MSYAGCSIIRPPPTATAPRPLPVTTSVSDNQAIDVVRGEILRAMWFAAPAESPIRSRIEIEFEKNAFRHSIYTPPFYQKTPPIFLTCEDSWRSETEIHRVASKSVARTLGLRYLEGGDIRLARKHGGVLSSDFVFESISFLSAGAITKFYKGHIDNPHANASDFQAAGGGCLLLKDFSAAAPSQQNLCLSVAEEKRYGDLNLSQAYIGVSDKEEEPGAVSGVYVDTNRFWRLHASITPGVDAFVAKVRSAAEYADRLGDMGVSDFVGSHPGSFLGVTPGRWDACIKSLRDGAAKQQSQDFLDVIPELQARASRILGVRLGSQYADFIKIHFTKRIDVGFASGGSVLDAVAARRKLTQNPRSSDYEDRLKP